MTSTKVDVQSDPIKFKCEGCGKLHRTVLYRGVARVAVALCVKCYDVLDALDL